MSSPRPIHIPSREILKEPHDSEPLHSYDEPSPLLDEEDDFHNRLSRSRRESSGSNATAGSFWRTSGDAPSFSSAQIKKQGQQAETVKSPPPAPPHDGRNNRSPGLLSKALQSQQVDSAASSVCIPCIQYEKNFSKSLWKSHPLNSFVAYFFPLAEKFHRQYSQQQFHAENGFGPIFNRRIGPE